MILHWIKSKFLIGSEEQRKIFFICLPIFLLISLMLIELVLPFMFAWMIIYFFVIFPYFESGKKSNNPAFPYAYKYPKVNAVVHSFYFSIAVMGLFGFSIRQFIFS